MNAPRALIGRMPSTATGTVAEWDTRKTTSRGCPMDIRPAPPCTKPLPSRPTHTTASDTTRSSNCQSIRADSPVYRPCSWTCERAAVSPLRACWNFHRSPPAERLVASHRRRARSVKISSTTLRMMIRRQWIGIRQGTTRPCDRSHSPSGQVRTAERPRYVPVLAPATVDRRYWVDGAEA